MSPLARFIALGALLFTSAAAHAQQGGRINHIELFQMLDTDRDAVITRGEVPEEGRAAFARLVALGDLDKDGKISQSEFRALVGRTGDPVVAGGGGGGVEAIFAARDKNQDGKLSRAEFEGLPAPFDRIDTDKDGFVSRGEALRFSRGGAVNETEARVKAMDRDGDGKVSRAEFNGPPAMFDQIDANHDGQIEPAEAQSFPSRKVEAFKKANSPPGKSAGRLEK